MRLTLISHACWLIETIDFTILTDPVLGDVFDDNLCTPCPTRSFNPEALPELDAIYVSHEHHDHFDPPTLAGLARRVPLAICAKDTVDVCKRVGFETVLPVQDFQEIKIGQTTLHITPATNRLQTEHGLLVTDPDGRIWNQVDSGFKPEWLPLLRIGGRALDVHLANFNAILINEAMSNAITRYPVAPYGVLLDTVRLAGAKLVIPGAVGLSWVNRGAWLNNYLFPTSHQQFLDDVRGFENESRAEIVMPGDTIEILQGVPVLHRQARKDLVATTDPSSMKLLDFNPTRPLPTLVEQDAATRITVGIENLGEIVTRNITVPAVGFVSTSEVEQGVGEVLGKINTTLSTSGQEFLKDTLKRWRTRMKVTIHFADGPRFWSCDFAAPKPAFTPGEIDRSNFYLEVTAVDLHAVEHGLIWDQFVLTGYRCYQTLYRVREEGIIYPVVPSQFHREVEAELGSGSDVPNPFDVFMALWGPSNKLWLDRLTELSIASPTAGS